MITKQIKYYTKQICFQEIPDEVSLTYFITNCPNRCKNCHSPHLRDDIGTLVSDTLEDDLEKNKDRISCVLFMGGDDNLQISSLINSLEICKKHGFKTALYSGYELDYLPTVLLKMLDYVKIGPYVDELGGLKSVTTNQRLYRLNNAEIEEDLTSRFWRRLDENYT